MAEAKSKVFIVVPTKQDASVPVVKRLVRAKRESEVAHHVLKDWSIAVATPDEIHALGKQGVDIEDVE